MIKEPLIPSPFLDWIDVWPGQSGRDEQDRAFLQDPPQGVRLSVQQAWRSEPFLRPERPWERQRINGVCVLLEDGRYRMWYGAQASDERDDSYHCYAESPDGVHWERPELGLCEFRGSKANNIVIAGDAFGFQCVFADPTAPPSERYKGIEGRAQLLRRGVPIPTDKQTKKQWRETRLAMEIHGHTPDQIGAEAGIQWQVLGVVSPDGLHWSALGEPLAVVEPSLDTQNIAAYDEDTGEYVAYLRDSVGRRRALCRTGGPEFGNWPPPRTVFATDPQDEVDDSIYTSAYCRCPDSGRHLMFPSIFHQLPGTIDIQLATSRDGWNWTRPERKPIVTRETEDGRYSCIYASPNLLPRGDDWVLPYYGTYSPHDWGSPPKPEPEGEFRWAVWKRGRLVALEAPTQGQFTTIQRVCKGARLLLNFQTEPGGWIRAAIVDKPRTPPGPVPEIEGYEMDVCDVMQGDELSKQVTWHGRGDLSALRGRTVCVRICMARARLFSFAL